jgi:hypothetical protein
MITTIIVDPWILGVAWRASIQGWNNMGTQPIMPEQLIFRFHKMEVEMPVSCIGQSTSDEKWGTINDWIYQIDVLLPKTSRHHVGAKNSFWTN